MSTIKNAQISLYCNFYNIIEKPEISFQSPPLSQKHVRIFFYSTLVLKQISF